MNAYVKPVRRRAALVRHAEDWRALKLRWLVAAVYSVQQILLSPNCNCSRDGNVEKYQSDKSPIPRLDYTSIRVVQRARR